MSVSCGSFLWAQRPNFLPKAVSSRTVQKVVGERSVLSGCLIFPRSLPPSLGRPPPSLGQGGSPRVRGAVARSREHFKASLARRLEEVYRLPLSSQASLSLRRLWEGGWGCALRFGFLAIFKDMSLGWPGMVAQPHSRPLSAFLSHSRQGNFNTVKIFDLFLLRAWI